MEDWTKYFSSFNWDRFEKIDQSQNWFKVFRIMPNTFAIWEPWHREMVISYLIVGTKHTLLFDTGLGIGDISKLVDELGCNNIIVLNSLSHWDHIGGNFQFNSVYGLNNEYARQNCKGKSYSKAKHYLINTVMEDKLPEDFKANSYSIKPYRITKYVKNGDVIDLGERKLEILLTPGHSLDSLCLLDSKNKGLFVGDTFYLASLYAHLAGSNLSDYYATSAKLGLMADDINILFTCHRQTVISSLYLKKMHEAFKEIKSTIGSTNKSEQNKEIQFEGFSVII